MSRNYVVGYGSLISHRSLTETIPDRVLTPVMIKGYHRVFNVVVENTDKPNVLNLQKSRGSICNAVIFEVNSNELKKIVKREKPEYKFKKTWTFDFNNGKKKCIAFIAVDDKNKIDLSKKDPKLDYFILCREAAYMVSKKFGICWDNTTYTSSGEKISSWIKSNPEYDSI